MHPAAHPRLRALETDRAPQRVGIVVALALHAVALSALLSYQPARSALLAAAPVMVDWISQLRAEPRKEAAKPKPQPVRPQPVAPAPLIAVADETPAPITVAAPPPIAAAPEPAPLTLPIFSADYLDNPAPLYPLLSRRLREQGRVMLRVLVNPGGRAEEVQVQSSSGHARLDAAARDAVRVWKFVPASRGAQSVPAWVLIPVSFRLEG